MSSDAGVLILREVEQRLGVAERLTGCIADPRAQNQVVHGLADMIRFRMLMIAAGYEDANAAVRSSPGFYTFETLRRAFLKIAVRVQELKSCIKVAFPSAYPYAPVLTLLPGTITVRSP